MSTKWYQSTITDKNIIYTYYLKNLELLEDFRYRLAGFRILSSNVTNIRFEVDIDIINDADISVTITNYNFDVYLNSFYLQHQH